MKTNYLLILSIIFIQFSCDNDDFDLPKTPKAVNYDLNRDSHDDIRIEYQLFTWDGINSSGDGISGYIKPLNGTSIWVKQTEYSLFNKLNDTIALNPKKPYYWEDFLDALIVSASYSSVNKHAWTSEWRIHTKTAMDFYYLGIRINKNKKNLIGWIKIKVNQSTGQIQIVDKEFTEKDFIVIGK